MSQLDPIERYLQAEARARERGVDTSPASLGTADAEGQPSVRMVLIRQVDVRGFVFHTNYNSRKVADLNRNPRAALCFFWPTVEQQIRVEGTTVRISEAESDEYFASRPRGSQIGAWASDQSSELPSLETLHGRARDVEQMFDGRPVTRPPHWGGIRVIPERIEFWYGRADRLHERLLYVRSGGATWHMSRLFP
jgi:pyridoxamine 5'-phosphate oxidase